jgi:hypothetical protein
LSSSSESPPTRAFPTARRTSQPSLTRLWMGTGRHSHLGFSHLGGRSRRSIVCRKEKNDCGQMRLSHVCGQLGLCPIPSGAFFCGSWPRMVKYYVW